MRRLLVFEHYGERIELTNVSFSLFCTVIHFALTFLRFWLVPLSTKLCQQCWCQTWNIMRSNRNRIRSTRNSFIPEDRLLRYTPISKARNRWKMSQGGQSIWWQKDVKTLTPGLVGKRWLDKPDDLAQYFGPMQHSRTVLLRQGANVQICKVGKWKLVEPS